MEEKEILIVGGGIAGTLLAWRLNQDGQSFRLFVGERDKAASRVAAGVLNPVTGKRMVAGWRVEDQLEMADRYYQGIGKELGRDYYHSCSIRRYLLSRAEEKFLNRRLSDPRYRQFISPPLPSGAEPMGIEDPLGSFRIAGAQVDLVRLIDDLHAEWLEQGRLLVEPFDYGALDPEGARPRYSGKTVRAVVFCEGIGILKNPWFGKLPFRPVKGETLSLTGPGIRSNGDIIHHRKWLLPLGPSQWRMGSTYDRGVARGEGSAELRSDAHQPLPQGRAELFEALSGMVPHPEAFEIDDHRAGVRPATRDRLPYLGSHPRYPNFLVMNGLGSKGALLAPWLSEILTGWLLRSQPIPPEMSVQRHLVG